MLELIVVHAHPHKADRASGTARQSVTHRAVNQFTIQQDVDRQFILVQVQEKVKAGLVPLNKYIITKQLTKRPEDYPDAKNQAHVQVALRRRAAGKRDGVMQVPSMTVCHSVLLHVLCQCCLAAT